VTGTFECDNEPLDSTICGEFLDLASYAGN
jgi:hypothetical protein